MDPEKKLDYRPFYLLWISSKFPIFFHSINYINNRGKVAIFLIQGQYFRFHSKHFRSCLVSVTFVDYWSVCTIWATDFLKKHVFIEQNKNMFSGIHGRSSVQQRTRHGEQKPDGVLWHCRRQPATRPGNLWGRKEEGSNPDVESAVTLFYLLILTCDTLGVFDVSSLGHSLIYGYPHYLYFSVCSSTLMLCQKLQVSQSHRAQLV